MPSEARHEGERAVVTTGHEEPFGKVLRALGAISGRSRAEVLAHDVRGPEGNEKAVFVPGEARSEPQAGNVTFLRLLV